MSDPTLVYSFLRHHLPEDSPEVQEWHELNERLAVLFTLTGWLANANYGIDFADMLAVENADAARRLQQENERLREAAELVCVTMEERGYGDMISFVELRAALAQTEDSKQREGW